MSISRPSRHQFIPIDDKNTLEHYPTLTMAEIDLIIGAVNRAGKKMSNGAIATRNNYRLIRAAYATVLLSLTENLTDDGDKLRDSALEKLQKTETVKLAIKITLDIDDDRSGNFINDLETLLGEYAEPSHKYRMHFQTPMPEK